MRSMDKLLVRLHKAAKFGELNKVDSYIKAGDEVNWKNEKEYGREIVVLLRPVFNGVFILMFTSTKLTECNLLLVSVTFKVNSTLTK